jgi:hypothetical protein
MTFADNPLDAYASIAALTSSASCFFAHHLALLVLQLVAS